MITLNGLLVFLTLIGAGLIALSIQRRWKTARSSAQNLLVSYITILAILGIGEWYCRNFYSDSGAWGYGVWRWRDLHYTINSLGYRDREWSDADLQGRTAVYLVGDSFTEGWGMANVEDRWGNVLAARLGDAYTVVNLGHSHTATEQQLDNLRDFPLRDPDVVIWQYYLNDVEMAALNYQLAWIPNVPSAPPIVDESWLVNTVYWYAIQTNFVGARVNAEGVPYWDWVRAAYDNFAVWEFHQRELQAMVDYVRSINARLIVVIFPELTDPVGSIAYVDRVAQALEAMGVDQVLTLYDAAAAYPTAEIVVSRFDNHPSVMFSRVVADLIYTEFFAP